MTKRKQKQRKRKRQRRSKTKSQRPKTQPSGPKNTLVDIVIPIFGEFGLALNAVTKIPEAAAPLPPEQYRVILLDNGTPNWESHEDGAEITPDEMAAPIKELLRPTLDLFLRVDKNIGYPAGINELAGKGRSPLILILTADVFLEPSAINNMIMVMDNPEVGVVGCKLLFPLEIESPHGPGGTVQHAGLAFGIQGKPYHVFMGWSPDHPKVNVRRDMAGVTGACFMTRRSLWDQAGGFDTRFGLGTFEDLDYCFKIRSMGKKVMFEPTAVGYHLVSGARLQGANVQGFNLPMNETIFRGNWAHMLAWDEWRYL